MSIITLICESDVLHTFFNHINPAEEHGGLITDYDENPFKADSSFAIRGSYLVLRETETATARSHSGNHNPDSKPGNLQQWYFLWFTFPAAGEPAPDTDRDLHGHGIVERHGD